MPKRIRGVVLSSDGATPQSGVVVEAFDPSTSFTQGEETTDERGQFILAGLQDRSWIARRKSGSGDIQIQVVTEALVVEDVHGQRSNIGAHEYKHLRNIPTRFLDPVLIELVNRLGSSGWISGGVVSDGGGNTVDVALGWGLFRAEDDETDALELLPWSLSEGLSVPSGTTRYVGVEYNSGSPQAIVVADEDDFDNTTKFELAVAVNDGSMIHISLHRSEALNAAWRTSRVLEEGFHIYRAIKTGGLILGTTGTRNITVTQGILIQEKALSRVGPIDTSDTDTMDRIYRAAGEGEWTTEAAETAWNNTQIDDGDGGLLTMSSNKWANVWVYVELDGGLVSLYPQAQFVTQAQAEQDTPPSTIPPRLQEHGILIGRIIFKKSTDDGVAESVFTTMFGATGVTEHGGLANIGTDDHHAESHDLDSHSDLNAGAPDDEDVLSWDSGTGKWVPVAGGGGGGDTLPVVDATSIAKGSGDNTKEVRFEVDGVSSGEIRVLTIQDKNITIADNADLGAHTATTTDPHGSTQTQTGGIDTPVISYTGSPFYINVTRAGSDSAIIIQNPDETYLCNVAVLGQIVCTGDLDVAGDILVDGTVDGVDVAQLSSNQASIVDTLSITAQSILANATGSSGTVTDFAIAAQRVLGRLTGENIKALTGAEVGSLIALANLSDVSGTTGTGNVVLSDAPDFTGHVDLSSSLAFEEQTVGFDEDETIVSFGSGNKQILTLTGDITLLTIMPTAGESNGTLLLKQGPSGGPHTITGWSAIRWRGGVEPTLSTAANAIDTVTFYFSATNGILAQFAAGYALV